MGATQDLIAAIEHATGRNGKRAGKETKLLCPCHDDHSPSLDVCEASDGSPLVRCRVCNAGLIEVAVRLGHQPSAYLANRPRQENWTPHGEHVAVYDYTDEQGQLLYQVCRTATKQFPVRRPDATAQHGWRWSLGDTRRVLYRLPEVVAAAASGATLHVCEGEKDADAIRRAGGVATCNPGGAGKWRDEYVPCLHGARVVIVADDDSAGVAHAQQVAASIAARGNGNASALRIVLPREGKDAADHLAAGHGLDDFRSFEGERLQLVPFAMTMTDFLALELEAPPSLLGTEQEAIVAAGSLTVLAGMPAAGKTTLALDLAFHLATGTDWLDITVPRTSRILIVENEGPEHKFQAKLRAKLQAWKGDVGGIYVHTWRWSQLSLRDEETREQLRHFLAQEQIDLVIGDPLDTLGTTGVGSPDDTRDFVAALADLGLGTTVAYLFLHHFRKEVSASEINQVSGAWGGRLDTLLVLKDTERPEELRLSFPKLRWVDQQKPPLILGKVKNGMTFNVLSEEVHTDATKVEAMLSRIIATLRKTGPMERQRLALNCETEIDSTFRRAISRGQSDGLIDSAKEGRKHVYTLTPEAFT